MSGLEDWTVHDPDGVLQVDGDRVSWRKADRSTVRYIEKRVDVERDFAHSFALCFKDGYVEDELNRGFIRLWEVREDWENRTWVFARKNGDSWNIFLEQLSEGEKTIAFAGSSKLLFDVRYRVKVTRSGDLYSLVVNKEDDVVEDSGELRGSGQGYSRIWLASTIKSRRNRGNWSTGYIEGFEID